jgi:hypothetical protein
MQVDYAAITTLSEQERRLWASCSSRWAPVFLTWAALQGGVTLEFAPGTIFCGGDSQVLDCLCPAIAP